MRMLRGSDILGIETGYDGGATAVSPDVANVAASICPGVRCKNLGSFYKNCTCLCADAWTGATCTTCSQTCGTNGNLDPTKCSCNCNDGYYGPSCQYYVVGTVQSATTITVKYSLDPATWKGSFDVRWFQDSAYWNTWACGHCGFPTNVNTASGTLTVPVPNDKDANPFYVGIAVHPRCILPRTLNSACLLIPLGLEHARSLGVFAGVARKERIRVSPWLRHD
jgi:hypothetical protein